MARYLIRKLGHFAPLSRDDGHLLEELARRRVATFAPGDELIGEGDRPQAVSLLVEGWAYRYKSFEDGRRQIVGFLLPGDLFDLNVLLLRAFDHSVAGLTPLVVAELDCEDLGRLGEQRRHLARALRWDALVQAAIQREWIVNVGRRTALERIAHLLCELYRRLEAIGLGEGRCCELPLTQTELADATGLSVVHVNRVLQQLRSSGLLRLHGRQMELPRLDELEQLALFDASYLHLEGKRPVSGEA